MIKLLIVDDEAASRKIIKAFVNFKDYGIELIGEAENGIEAMNYINSPNCPDILITDMNMPVMDGISLLQYLIDCGSSIKIIVISGYYDFPYTHISIKANVQDYLLKPLEYDKVNKVIADCVKEINLRDKIIVSPKPSPLQIDLKTYQKILKYGEKMYLTIKHGNETNIHLQLQELKNDLHEYNTPNILALLYQIVSDALNRYCVEENYEPVLIPNLKFEDEIDLTNVVFEQLQTLYINKYRQIQSRLKSQSTLLKLNEIHEYINNHYLENLNIDHIATKYYINKDYLSTIFKKKYGETINNYIIRLKIENAKRQLQYSNNSIKEIAASLGYMDPCYFNKQFKKVTGITPGQFQQGIKTHSKKF